MTRLTAAEKKMLTEMDVARRLLKAHGYTLYGFDPGVTATDDNGGTRLEMDGLGWRLLRDAWLQLEAAP